ncbi:hypothetical protein [Planktotalea arctica]|uniref:hypothetical protein n=1 Tax=Planktotalea arctica TaxID=1481893 RepID=UPI000A173047|nr:hypothetical protein [Planktotalea arctica]
MAKQTDFKSARTQVAWACDALRAWRKISHQMQQTEVGGWRLGSIIHRLKHDFDWPIEKEERGPQNVAFYFLKAGTDLSKLKMPPSALSLSDDGAA